MDKIKSTKKDFFIGFDMDGVIIDHTASKLKLAKKFGLKLKPEETHSKIIRTLIKEPMLREIQYTLYHDPDFYKFSPLMSGAKEGLRLIKKEKLPFVLISRRKDPKIAIKTLKFHGLWPKTFNYKNTFFVKEPEDKNIKAKELGVTHYIDDETSVLEKLVDVKNKFLFDNFGAFKSSKNYKKVSSWSEFLNKL